MYCACGQYAAPDDYLCFRCGYDLRGTHTAEGMNAMGVPILRARRQHAIAWLYEPEFYGLFLSAWDRVKYVNYVADLLERDDPDAAMNAARARLDVTGAYRLFAYLLAS